ncbi:glutaredoxin family protein [Rhodococcus sp. BP-149]|nr:glutaredoxin family protein [Rhodococcus sp. BP-288]MBY6696412.1 glutaredoxin family protein [Rhodococcus sp. BP-188]MBY6700544.1 glutaredoxin family protein [Rhodococcus sp. BP-285]MBY6704433.1 glutaredoxin family protein [Rhodococcus sp. BP-283]MBY6713669.1 glutaredoxin family protein [Rhodococcus sp. BP-160]MBY6717079.1 glutaredoxin family protein [Rhodococcus sp. BP-110]MBY6722300.1 glutaredoxin family protein [Rhodococcus sp. BP-142]MBY6726305.1 glutaredoxin family protein [Rhodococc
MSGITVYTKPNCQQCRATFRALDKAGLDYTAVDISADTEARESQCVCQHEEVSTAA